MFGLEDELYGKINERNYEIVELKHKLELLKDALKQEEPNWNWDVDNWLNKQLIDLVNSCCGEKVEKSPWEFEIRGASLVGDRIEVKTQYKWGESLGALLEGILKLKNNKTSS